MDFSENESNEHHQQHHQQQQELTQPTQHDDAAQEEVYQHHQHGHGHGLGHEHEHASMDFHESHDNGLNDDYLNDATDGTHDTTMMPPYLPIPMGRSPMTQNHELTGANDGIIQMQDPQTFDQQPFDQQTFDRNSNLDPAPIGAPEPYPRSTIHHAQGHAHHSHHGQFTGAFPQPNAQGTPGSYGPFSTLLSTLNDRGRNSNLHPSPHSSEEHGLPVDGQRQIHHPHQSYREQRGNPYHQNIQHQYQYQQSEHQHHQIQHQHHQVQQHNQQQQHHHHHQQQQQHHQQQQQQQQKYQHRHQHQPPQILPPTHHNPNQNLPILHTKQSLMPLSTESNTMHLTHPTQPRTNMNTNTNTTITKTTTTTTITSPSKTSFLTIPQAIALVHHNNLHSGPRKRKAFSVNMNNNLSSSYNYSAYPSRYRYHPREPNTLPSAQTIAKSIPNDASSIFHILDRRIDMDEVDDNPSYYELMRKWVRDDPYRQEPVKGGRILDYLVLPMEQRLSNEQDFGREIENLNQVLLEEKEMELESGNGDRVCDLLTAGGAGASMMNSVGVAEVKLYMKDIIRKGSRRRKLRNKLLKKKDELCLKRLDRSLGVKVAIKKRMAA